MQIVRSCVLLLLLFGSLLPGGGTIQLIAAALAAPLVVFELIHSIPLLHWVVPGVVLLFGILLFPLLVNGPVGFYGDAKAYDLMTLSLFTALCACLIRNERDVETFAWVWIIFGAVIAGLAYFGSTGAGDRAVGIGEANPIGLARALALSIIAVIWLSMRHRLHWVFTVVLLALYGLGMFETGSKGPLIGSIAAIFVMIISTKRHRIKRCLALAVALFAVYGLVVTNDSLVDTRLGEFIADPAGVNDPIRELALVTSGERIQEMLTSSWVGTGYGSWQEQTAHPFLLYPHNIWAELAIEAGILTAVGVALFVVWIVIRLMLLNSPDAQLIVALIIAETVSATLSGDARARALWFLLALGFVVVRRSVKKSVKPVTTSPILTKRSVQPQPGILR